MERRKFILKSAGFCGSFSLLSSRDLFAETNSQALGFNFINRNLFGEIQWIRRNKNEKNMSLVSLLNFGDEILDPNPEFKNHSAFTYREDHGVLFLSNHTKGNIHWILFYEEYQQKIKFHLARLDESKNQLFYETSCLIDNNHDSNFPINTSYELMKVHELENLNLLLFFYSKKESNIVVLKYCQFEKKFEVSFFSPEKLVFCDEPLDKWSVITPIVNSIFKTQNPVFSIQKEELGVEFFEFENREFKSITSLQHNSILKNKTNSEEFVYLLTKQNLSQLKNNLDWTPILDCLVYDKTKDKNAFLFLDTNYCLNAIAFHKNNEPFLLAKSHFPIEYHLGIYFIILYSMNYQNPPIIFYQGAENSFIIQLSENKTTGHYEFQKFEIEVDDVDLKSILNRTTDFTNLNVDGFLFYNRPEENSCYLKEEYTNSYPCFFRYCNDDTMNYKNCVFQFDSQKNVFQLNLINKTDYFYGLKKQGYDNVLNKTFHDEKIMCTLYMSLFLRLLRLDMEQLHDAQDDPPYLRNFNDAS